MPGWIAAAAAAVNPGSNSRMSYSSWPPRGARAGSLSRPAGGMLARMFARLVLLWGLLGAVPALGSPAPPREVARVALPGQVLQVAWAPDGAHYAASGFFDAVWVWDARTHAVKHRLPLPKDAAGVALVFSPDGKRLAVGGRAMRARVWQVATGAVVFDHAAEPGETSQLHGLAFLPGGDLVYAPGDALRVALPKGDTVAQLLRPDDLNYVPAGLAASADGRWLVARTDELHVWDLKSGTVAARLREKDRRAGPAVVGREVVFAARRPGALYAAPLPALKPAVPLPLSTRELSGLRARGDRVVVAAADGAYVVDVPKRAAVAHAPATWVKDADLSPDGRHLLAAVGAAVVRFDLSPAP